MTDAEQTQLIDVSHRHDVNYHTLYSMIYFASTMCVFECPDSAFETLFEQEDREKSCLDHW